MAEVIEALKPMAMAIEQLYSHYQRPRTAILMGHARGVICLAAAQAGMPVIHYSADARQENAHRQRSGFEVADAAGRAARAAA